MLLIRKVVLFMLQGACSKERFPFELHDWQTVSHLGWAEWKYLMQSREAVETPSPVFQTGATAECDFWLRRCVCVQALSYGTTRRFHPVLRFYRPGNGPPAALTDWCVSLPCVRARVSGTWARWRSAVQRALAVPWWAAWFFAPGVLDCHGTLTQTHTQKAATHAHLKRTHAHAWIWLMEHAEHQAATHTLVSRDLPPPSNPPNLPCTDHTCAHKQPHSRKLSRVRRSLARVLLTSTQR